MSGKPLALPITAEAAVETESAGEQFPVQESTGTNAEQEKEQENTEREGQETTVAETHSPSDSIGEKEPVEIPDSGNRRWVHPGWTYPVSNTAAEPGNSSNRDDSKSTANGAVGGSKKNPKSVSKKTQKAADKRSSVLPFRKAKSNGINAHNDSTVTGDKTDSTAILTDWRKAAGGLPCPRGYTPVYPLNSDAAKDATVGVQFTHRARCCDCGNRFRKVAGSFSSAALRKLLEKDYGIQIKLVTAELARRGINWFTVRCPECSTVAKVMDRDSRRKRNRSAS